MRLIVIVTPGSVPGSFFPAVGPFGVFPVRSTPTAHVAQEKTRSAPAENACHCEEHSDEAIHAIVIPNQYPFLLT